MIRVALTVIAFCFLAGLGLVGFVVSCWLLVRAWKLVGILAIGVLIAAAVAGSDFAITMLAAGVYGVAGWGICRGLDALRARSARKP
ncbi:MAG: hypothetical protein ACRDFS_07260 [Chloroflexota bacterium]